ncbi:MAG: hypothetical protein WKG00_37390 [Polyangiaceae bacterium]
MSKTILGTMAALCMLTCTSCGLLGGGDDDDADLDAGTVPTPPPIDPALVIDAATPAIPQPVTPTPVTPTPVSQPRVDAGTSTDAGTATDAGATDAGAKADAGAGPNAQNCFAKCQGLLATCLTPQAGKDGGLPTFGDATKCKAAQDTCQAACK